MASSMVAMNKKGKGVVDQSSPEAADDCCFVCYDEQGGVYKLLKNPESFEEKVTGCFIRVMSNTDYSSGKSYELMQVTGVKNTPTVGDNTDIILLSSTVPKEIHISRLSDSRFSEEKNNNQFEKRSEGQKTGMKKPVKAENMKKKAKRNRQEIDVAPSPYASIEAKNIKLVYLRRKLAYKLLKNPESFEEKVTGCFIRVMSNTDYSSGKSYELMQVTGVKNIPTVEDNTDIILLSSTMPKEIHISRLSDSRFSEEECEALRRKVLAGQLKRPTVEELQQKANILHCDITKRLIREGLSAMRKYAWRAADKGQEDDLAECLEEIRKFESPSEQNRWLTNVHSVIPDRAETDTMSEDIENNMQNEESSPPSIPPM